MLDFNKPIETRDGKAVKILLRDGTPDEVKAIVGAGEYTGDETIAAMVFTEYGIRLTAYNADGSYYDANYESDFDLVNAPEDVVRYAALAQAAPAIGSLQDELRVIARGEGGWADKSLKITYRDGEPHSVELI